MAKGKGTRISKNLHRAFVGQDLEGTSCIYISLWSRADGGHAGYASEKKLQQHVDRLNKRKGFINE